MTARAARALLCLLAPAVVTAAVPREWYQSTATTVLDTRTGLTWQRVPSTTPATASAAAATCQALALGGFSTGWRLPTIKELLTLVNEDRGDPAIDIEAFPDTVSVVYWSSTPAANQPGMFWGLAFMWGTTDIRSGTDTALARCVR